MFRVCDLILSLAGLLALSPIFVLVYAVVLLDTGSPIFRQERIGRYGKSFVLLKFRTMKINTSSVATHLVEKSAVTRSGGLLRKLKVDELPQLWNVLKGEMSLVGPRPGLFNQEELTHARELLGVYAVRPGITGLAQIHGIDMSTPNLLAQTDAKMIEQASLKTYFALIFQTIKGRGRGDRVGGV